MSARTVIFQGIAHYAEVSNKFDGTEVKEDIMDTKDRIPFSDDSVKEDNLPRTPWAQEGITIFKDIAPEDIIRMGQEGRCPEMITKRAGDESLDFCKLNDKVCLLVGGDTCSIWNEIQRESEQ